jgi:hypothetical protein
MAKYATGKYAKAISDRSGMEFPYKEMVHHKQLQLQNQIMVEHQEIQLDLEM